MTASPHLVAVALHPILFIWVIFEFRKFVCIASCRYAVNLSCRHLLYPVGRKYLLVVPYSALKQYDLCDRKIRARGQSIVGAANKLISYGIPQNAKKPLPPEVGMEELE